MKEIPLTQGKVALVDDADYDWLSQHNWYYTGYYAARWHNGKNRSMHRLILNDPESVEVDHINHNKLDNQRANLRLATRRENARNCTKASYGRALTSQFKGVSWHQRSHKWRAQLTIRSNESIKVQHLGLFVDEAEAARAYDAAARSQFGEFASTNF